MFKNAKVIGDNIDSAVYLRQEPGINRGHKDFVMSRGELMKLLRCPSKWIKGGDDDSSESKDYGSLVDVCVLTPNKFDAVYVVAPENYPAEPKKKGDVNEVKPWNRNSNYCKAWEKENEDAGKIVIKSDELLDVKTAVKAVRENPIASAVLSVSKKQVMVIAEWHDEATGLIIPVKTLNDFVPEKDSKFGTKMGDFKTTKSAMPEEFERSIFNFNYDAQAWLNRELYRMATGERREDWQFIIQENSAPWECPAEQPMLPLESFDDGKMKITRALKKYCQCLATGKWPGYSIGTRIRISENSYIAKRRDYDSLKMMEDSQMIDPKPEPKPDSGHDVIP